MGELARMMMGGGKAIPSGIFANFKTLNFSESAYVGEAFTQITGASACWTDLPTVKPVCLILRSDGVHILTKVDEVVDFVSSTQTPYTLSVKMGRGVDGNIHLMAKGTTTHSYIQYAIGTTAYCLSNN